MRNVLFSTIYFIEFVKTSEFIFNCTSCFSFINQDGVVKQIGNHICVEQQLGDDAERLIPRLF